MKRASGQLEPLLAVRSESPFAAPSHVAQTVRALEAAVGPRHSALLSARDAVMDAAIEAGDIKAAGALCASSLQRCAPLSPSASVHDAQCAHDPHLLSSDWLFASTPGHPARGLQYLRCGASLRVRSPLVTFAVRCQPS